MTFPNHDNIDAKRIAERPAVNFVEPERDGAKLRLLDGKGGVRKCTEFRPSELLMASRCAGRPRLLVRKTVGQRSSNAAAVGDSFWPVMAVDCGAPHSPRIRQPLDPGRAGAGIPRF